MICPRCGYEMKEEHLYCERCGAEIQIVPDFEPEIQNSIEETLSTVAWEINQVLSENSSDLKKKPQKEDFLKEGSVLPRDYFTEAYFNYNADLCPDGTCYYSACGSCLSELFGELSDPGSRRTHGESTVRECNLPVL